MTIQPVPVSTKSDAHSKLDEPFIAGTQSLYFRAYLIIALFFSGLAATGMITYVGTTVDYIWAMHSVSEPTRLLSTFLPHGNSTMSMIIAIMPFLFAVCAIMVVARSQSIVARILGFSGLIGLLSISVMAFLPA